VLATPALLVVAEDAVNVPPVGAAVKFTVAPLTGAPVGDVTEAVTAENDEPFAGIEAGLSDTETLSEAAW
jgi:hypothetical protein